MVVWWKMKNLLMSTGQMREAGTWPLGPTQLRLWIGKP
jgi:hypothetical protein